MRQIGRERGKDREVKEVRERERGGVHTCILECEKQKCPEQIGEVVGERQEHLSQLNLYVCVIVLCMSLCQCSFMCGR